MLSRSRTKRAEKYAEEGESMLVDAESIYLFVDNTTKLSTQEVCKGINRKRSDATNSSAKEFNPLVPVEGTKRKTNISAKDTSESVPTHTCVRSPQKAKALPEHEDENLPEITATLPSPISDVTEDDLFTSFENFNHRKSSARKIRDRLGENLSPEGWDLCNEKYPGESTFKFQKSVPIKKGAKTYDDRPIKSDLSISEDKIVFLDIFEESKQQNVLSRSSRVGNEIESPAKRRQHLRRIRSHSEKNNGNQNFTDFCFSDEESSGKSSLRELPWGKSTPKLKPCGDTLGIIPPSKNTPGHLYPGESTVADLYPGKDIQEKKIPEEKPPEVDNSKIMEDSHDLVDVLNNSSGDQFTDTQGVKSFVCLVDQLTDLRVRHKFNGQYAGRRRQAVCDELEKTIVWNERSLYEYRRDLNIRKALNNMFM